MINKLIIVLLFSTYLLSKEVSVFGAGNINSDKPYGLTASEKVVYDNKKNIKNLNNRLESLSYKLLNMKSSYNDLNERLQGITSVYENDSENINKTKKSINSISNNIETTNITIDKLKQLTLSNSDSIISLEKRLDDYITLQNLNNQKVEKLLNNINKNYVSKKQFDELVNYVNSNKKTKLKAKTKTIVKKVSRLTNKQKLAKAIKMVNKRYFTKSLPIWNELLKSNYMPATVNYYMGEVRFGKRNYKKAIHHYKTSMMLYDEADYIPNLLLHSAMSFENIKDNENALNFYNTLIDVYENSKEAKIAKKQLKNLK